MPVEQLYLWGWMRMPQMSLVRMRRFSLSRCVFSLPLASGVNLLSCRSCISQRTPLLIRVCLRMQW